ncbi:MAG: hypothetical protein N3A68_07710 [Bacteroidia bacterium]|jgi:hypothetical protein|nr:hypothetical protein [Bacteroidia bacterium]
MTPNTHLNPIQIRAIARGVFGFKLFTLLLAVYTDTPPSIKTIYIQMRGLDALLGGVVAIFLHVGKPYTTLFWRFALNIYAFAGFLIEATLTYPLNSGLFLWIPMVGGLTGVLLFNAADEHKYSQLALIGSAFLSLLGFLLHDKVAFIPPNPLSSSALTYILLIIGEAFVGYFFMEQNNKNFRRILELAQAQQESLQKQEELTRALDQERAEAEKRKAEAEAALQEVLRLQAEERRRAEREAFFAQYETLMRTAYTEPLSTFLRKLLEAFHQDLPMLGAVTYLRQPDGWAVQATYALKPTTTTFPNQGLLATAAHLKKPYLIVPPPKGTPTPPVSLHQPQPAALLYLPFFAEATQETIGIAELLLLEVSAEELLSRLEALLPRIGTYLWVRQLQVTPLSA